MNKAPLKSPTTQEVEELVEEITEAFFGIGISESVPAYAMDVLKKTVKPLLALSAERDRLIEERGRMLAAAAPEVQG